MTLDRPGLLHTAAKVGLPAASMSIVLMLEVDGAAEEWLGQAARLLLAAAASTLALSATVLPSVDALPSHIQAASAGENLRTRLWPRTVGMRGRAGQGRAGPPEVASAHASPERVELVQLAIVGGSLTPGERIGWVRIRFG